MTPLATFFSCAIVQGKCGTSRLPSAPLGEWIAVEDPFGDDSLEEESEMMTAAAEVSEGITVTFIKRCRD
jgi:hypothetical protein